MNHGVVRLFASSVAAFLTFGIALSLVGAEIAEGPGAGRQATSAAYNYDAPAAPTTPSPSAQTGAIRRYDHPAQRLRRAIAAVDSRLAAEGVPDAWIVVRGGTKELPPPGEVFSGAAGRTLDEAASGVPHGTIRQTTAGQIRAGGGTVKHAPELTRGGNVNDKHVNICLGPGPCPFGPPQPNPVPPGGRIR